MAFEKGQNKPAKSGRKKNEVARLFTLRESLALSGFDIGIELRKLLDNPDATIDQKLNVINTILRYTHSVPAPVAIPADHNPDEGDTVIEVEACDVQDLEKLAKG